MRCSICDREIHMCTKRQRNGYCNVKVQQSAGMDEYSLGDCDLMCPYTDSDIAESTRKYEGFVRTRKDFQKCNSKGRSESYQMEVDRRPSTRDWW